MAKTRAKLGFRSNGVVNRPSCSPDQRERYPNLASVLEGEVDHAGVEQVPAFAVTLFAGPNAIRFAVGCRATGETYFGTTSGSADVLGAIEMALEKGDLEAKHTARNGGNTPF